MISLAVSERNDARRERRASLRREPMRPRCLLALLLLTGCSSSGWNGRVYHGEGFAFQLPDPPAHWEPLDVSDASLAFRDAAHGGTALINGRCGMDGDDVPLSALTQHLFLHFTEREVRTQEVVPFDGREAMHTVLDAKLDGVPMRYEVWVLKKDGCVYDLLYVAPPDRFEQGRVGFRSMVQGFKTVSPNGD